MNKEQQEFIEVINKWGPFLKTTQDNSFKSDFENSEFKKMWKKNFDSAMGVNDVREYELISDSQQFIEQIYGEYV